MGTNQGAVGYGQVQFQQSAFTQQQAPPPPPPETAVPSLIGVTDLDPPPPPTAPEFVHDSREESRGGYCEVCDRSFRTAELLEYHEAEDHVYCDFERCSWSGPPDALLAHKIAHITDASGKKLAESPTETELWLRARKRARAVNGQFSADERERVLSEGSCELSVLEKTLRSEAGLDAKSKHSSKPAYKVFPSFNKYVKVYNQRRRELLSGARTDGEFPICPIALSGKRCTQICKKSHDLTAYRRWESNRHRMGTRIHGLAMMRQGVRVMLLQDEIQTYEQQLLVALKAIHDTNYLNDFNNPGSDDSIRTI
ncbi:putative zinc finger protein [Gregarina niphandrodes]|uniref:Zinc finger protein n=1 Tax=Gregarina niphandrodes TaxID=110365 RepID=A0A023BDJ7_GRENI|nr:putative zinc finger protein [Gregarina niphandrodes]EZG89019.1 putative zinc finger protein [Gregarina niphandrodes]|eukprot:XP_011128526.1 putative zinc finger protein [Gregarina niphandrodes]